MFVLCPLSQGLQVLGEIVDLRRCQAKKLLRVVGLHDILQCCRRAVVEVRCVLPYALQRAVRYCLVALRDA